MKSEKGFTGVDIAISVVILMTFVTVITSMFYNLAITSNRIKRKAEATNIAIRVIETMKILEFDKLTEGMTLDDINNLSNNKIEVPNGYTVTVGVDNSTYPDVIKIISVQVDYKIGKQDEDINIETLVKMDFGEEVTITYDANGGTGEPEPQTTYSTQSIKISTVEPTKNNFIFKGWSKTKDGDIDYKPGETAIFSADTRLYAVWAVKRKILMSFTNLSGSTADSWEKERFPKIKEGLEKSSDYSYDIDFKVGDEALEYLKSITDGSANYDLIVMHEAVWEVPEVANELALKYDLVTIGNDSTTDLDIIESSTRIIETPVNGVYPKIVQKMSQTELGKQLINLDVENKADDNNMTNIKFKDNVQVLYKVSIECPELSKTYGEGDGIGLVNNTATGKMWIHSNFTIRESDNNIELLRRLIEYILNNT